MYSLLKPFVFALLDPSGFMVNSDFPRVLSFTYSLVAKILVALRPIDKITATANIPIDLK